MKSAVLAIAFHIANVVTQTTVSNPEVYISGCDALSCTNSNSGVSQLCNDDIRVRGVGIAPRVVQIPGSNMNLSLSLVDGDPDGMISAPYRYLFNTQKLYIGASPDLDLPNQQPGCALMFQYQAQTFPFLTGTATPNTTQCGDALSSHDMELLANYALDFDFNTSSNSDASEHGVPRCAALAQYLKYQTRNDPAFIGYYYENLVTITGGAFSGSDLNTTSDTQQYGSCQPILPQDYQLYHVLDAQQVLHPDAGYDAGRGGRNGTTPVMTVMYGSNGTAPDVQFFCMQQLAPGNRQLPKDQLNVDSAAHRGTMHNAFAVGITSLAATVLLSL